MYKFIIFSPAFNCDQFIEKHIHSVNIQTNTNYIHILIDDASTDSTYKIISKYRNKQHLVFSTATNQKWIANSLVFLPKIAQDEDIIICLDADDWFADSHVLEYLASVYETEQPWLTYGQFFPTNPSWMGNRAKPFQHREFRKHKWVFTHLKTFKFFLFNAINPNDFLGPDGNYATMTYDMAIMFPMLELCPSNKIKFINRVLCIYNINNPLCVEKTNQKKQREMEYWFRSKNPYKILER